MPLCIVCPLTLFLGMLLCGSRPLTLLLGHISFLARKLLGCESPLSFFVCKLPGGECPLTFFLYSLLRGECPLTLLFRCLAILLSPLFGGSCSPPLLLAVFADLHKTQKSLPIRRENGNLAPFRLEPDLQPGADETVDFRDLLKLAVHPEPAIDVSRKIRIDDVVLLRSVPLVEPPLLLHLVMPVARRPHLEDHLREYPFLLGDRVTAPVTLGAAKRHIDVRRLANDSIILQWIN